MLDFEFEPENIVELKELPEEVENSVFVTLDSVDIFDAFLLRFSSLAKIKRIFSYCMCFIERLKKRAVAKTLAVDQREAHGALLLFVKLVQGRYFENNIR